MRRGGGGGSEIWRATRCGTNLATDDRRGGEQHDLQADLEPDLQVDLEGDHEGDLDADLDGDLQDQASVHLRGKGRGWVAGGWWWYWS